MCRWFVHAVMLGACRGDPSVRPPRGRLGAHGTELEHRSTPLGTVRRPFGPVLGHLWLFLGAKVLKPKNGRISGRMARIAIARALFPIATPQFWRFSPLSLSLSLGRVRLPRMQLLACTNTRTRVIEWFPSLRSAQMRAWDPYQAVGGMGGFPRPGDHRCHQESAVSRARCDASRL